MRPHELGFFNLAAYDRLPDDVRVRRPPGLTHSDGLPGSDQPSVVADEPVGAVQDFEGTAVALRQLDGLQLVVAALVVEPLGTGPVPLVDDLVVTRDDEEVVPATGCDQPDQIVLRPVRVLELVHADVRPSQPHHPRARRLFPEEPVREVQQAAEVEAVGGDQRVAVPAKEAWQLLRSGGQRGRRTIPPVRFREEPIDQVQQVGAVRRQFDVPVR